MAATQPSELLAVDPHPVLWPDRKKGPWAIRLRWAVIHGRAECIGFDAWFSVAPDPTDENGVAYLPMPEQPLRAISTDDLRSVQFGALVTEQRQALIKRSGGLASMIRDPKYRQGFTDETAKAFQALETAVAPDRPPATARRGRPPSKPPEHYIEVARVYTDARVGGRAPTQAVASHFDVSSALASKWVNHARNKLHLLPATSPGIANSDMSPLQTSLVQQKKNRKVESR